METRASYILVGSFVLGMIAALIGVAVWLAGIEFDKKPTKYLTYFGGDVTGLGIGSPVRYRGVPMGSVRDIRLDPENVERVRVLMEVSSNTPIKVDTRAEISLQGITGVAFVQLTGGTQAAARLVAKPGEIAVIESNPSFLQEVIGKLPQFVGKAVSIADRVGELFNKQNMDAVSATLRNLQKLTATMQSEQGDLRQLLLEGRSAAVALRDAANDIHLITDQVNEKIGPLFSTTEQTMADISSAATTINKITDNIQAILDDSKGPLRDFSQSGLYEFSQFIAEARILVDSLTRLTNRIERDPSQFLFGDSQKGVQAR